MESAGQELVTTAYTLMVLVFIVTGLIEVILVLRPSFLSGRRRNGSDQKRSRHTVLLVVMALLGWIVFVLGTYWIHPRQPSLAHGLHAGGAHFPLVVWRDQLSLIAAMCMTMVAYVLLRYKDSDAEQQLVRTAASTLGLIVLIATGTTFVLTSWPLR